MSENFTLGGFVRRRARVDEKDTDDQPVAGGILLNSTNVPGIENCLGVLTMPAGTVSGEAVVHETGEVMYVAAGSGELRTDEGPISFFQGDALFIPAGAWHWLASNGTDHLVSVFSFPAPDRPASRTRIVT